MKRLVAFAMVLGFSAALVGCGGGISPDDFKAVWKTAIDGYYKDLEGAKGDASKVDDIAKRLDKAAAEKGAKDWNDLCQKAAQADPDGYKKVTEEMTKYSTDAATEYSKKATEAATKAAEEKK
jgi:hypothetical protein